MKAFARALALLALIGAACPARADEPSEQVQSDISTREISIQSNFTGIEVVLFGSIDFARPQTPDDKPYDVITVIRSPSEAMVARRKKHVAGVWVNGASETFRAVPGFCAVLASRPLRAIASEEMLKANQIGLDYLDFGLSGDGTPPDPAFRSAMIRLQESRQLFQEKDDAISFIGRSLFRASVDLPVNVPLGRYAAEVFLFRDGRLINKNESTFEVQQVGMERMVYRLAFRHPVLYGALGVLIAVLAGLIAWALFRRNQ